MRPIRDIGVTLDFQYRFPDDYLYGRDARYPPKYHPTEFDYLVLCWCRDNPDKNFVSATIGLYGLIQVTWEPKT